MLNRFFFLNIYIFTLQKHVKAMKALVGGTCAWAPITTSPCHGTEAFLADAVLQDLYLSHSPSLRTVSMPGVRNMHKKMILARAQTIPCQE